MEQFLRSSLIIGENNTKLLQQKTVLLCGIGGVGSYTLEALVRMGIGHIILVDNDKVSITNLNRQLIALNSTIGQLKVDVAKNRALDINTNLKVDTYPIFINDDTIDILFKHHIDYIVDAVDTVNAKINLIKKANELNIPIISSMGTGNKLDPTKLHITDISKTEYCPLAKTMRYELRKINIKHLKVLTSKEPPIKIEQIKDENNRIIIGSTSFVPSTAGLIIASEVINDLINSN